MKDATILSLKKTLRCLHELTAILEEVLRDKETLEQQTIVAALP